MVRIIQVLTVFFKIRLGDLRPEGALHPSKVHAPFKQRVLNRTLNTWNINTKRVVIFTPFQSPISFEWGDFWLWGAEKGRYFRKTLISGEFLGNLGNF